MLSYHFFFFFFNATPTTEIYTLSLHDALPIWREIGRHFAPRVAEIGHDDPQIDAGGREVAEGQGRVAAGRPRSEEHTSELQSRPHLVCRLLLEKKKKKRERIINEENRATRCYK